jgi:dCMP deaminase
MAEPNFNDRLKEFIEKEDWFEGSEENGVIDESRPGPDEYFMKMAHLVKERATCTRRKVGAVIVKDRHLLSTGYNGNPKGMKHCNEIGCLREELKVPSGERHELCTGLHAEQNAIIQSSVFGTSIKDATMYCTNTPCSVCAKMLVNAGIKELVYDDGYPDELAMKILSDSRIKVRKLDQK